MLVLNLLLKLFKRKFKDENESDSSENETKKIAANSSVVRFEGKFTANKLKKF